MNTTFLENYLRENIPLSIALGVAVSLATPKTVILTAPIRPNINHKSTAFGGSLHSVATLACWSLLFINLKQLNIHAEIVISSSDAKYLAPVTTDFKAECTLENNHDLDRFEKMLVKKGKARIKLHATIYQSETLALDYYGEFVAIKMPL